MRYAKAIVAIVTTMLLAAQTAIPMSTGAHGWVTVLLSGLGTAAVYLVPNAPPFAAPRPPAVSDEQPFIEPPVQGRYTVTPPKE